MGQQLTLLLLRDLEEFRREKMRFWTRAGYAFEGKWMIIESRKRHQQLLISL
jgi:hypothetical protein